MDFDKAIQVLYFGNDQNTSKALVNKCEKHGMVVNCTEYPDQGLMLLKNCAYDVLVINHELSQYNGMELVQNIVSNSDLPPTIMLLEPKNEKIAIEAHKWGVSESLVKDDGYINSLPNIIKQVYQFNKLSKIKECTEIALLKSEEIHRALLNAIPDIKLQILESGLVVGFRSHKENDHFFTPQNILGNNIDEIFPEEISRETMRYMQRALSFQQKQIYEFSLFTGDKTRYYENRMVVCGEGEVLAIIRDITDRVNTEKEKEQLIVELEEALLHIRTLKGLIPICSSCKKIRDDDGYWSNLEDYIQKHSDAMFSHSYCPSCVKENFPEVYVEGKFH